MGLSVFKLVFEDTSSGQENYQIVGNSKISESSSEISSIRLNLNSLLPNPLSTSILKSLDEQTVIALKCAHQATRWLNNLQNWGVIVCPKIPGRKRVFSAFEKFKVESAWGISPHVAPYDSLHSPSGILSIAFQMHGLNLGSGGYAGMEGQAALAGFTALKNNYVSGLLLIWTGYREEYPLPSNEADNKQVIDGFALAITPKNTIEFNKKNICFIWNKSPINQTLTTPLSLETLFKIPDDLKTEWTFQVAPNVFVNLNTASTQG